MSISHLLESFDGLRAGGKAVRMSEDFLEDQKLEAFEKGYKAGWDDAARAQADETSRVTADFAANLKELSFTYHEAYGHMVRSLEPLLRQVVDALLPAIARAGLGAMIAEQLSEAAKTLAQPEAEIVVSPANAASLGPMLDADLGFPVALVEEPSLGDGQAYLRFGSSERQIDLDAVLSEAARAVDTYFSEVENTMRKEA